MAGGQLERQLGDALARLLRDLPLRDGELPDAGGGRQPLVVDVEALRVLTHHQQPPTARGASLAAIGSHWRCWCLTTSMLTLDRVPTTSSGTETIGRRLGAEQDGRTPSIYNTQNKKAKEFFMRKKGVRY